MKVLSLFDGISCGRAALERAGIPVERYVAYEIEPNVIKISKKNYPQIEQCGDVFAADFTQFKGFDLLIGGSPCTHLPLEKKIEYLAKVTGFDEVSVCEDVSEHYVYWKECVNFNKEDCCNLKK